MTVGTMDVAVVRVPVINLDPVFITVGILAGDSESTEANLNSTTFIRKLDEVLALNVGGIGVGPVW